MIGSVTLRDGPRHLNETVSSGLLSSSSNRPNDERFVMLNFMVLIYGVLGADTVPIDARYDTRPLYQYYLRLQACQRSPGTKSFALTMVDPEGSGGLGVFHWVAYGIPPNVTFFAEGEVSKESDKYVCGKSTQGVRYYSGPCTPPGSPHHYTFVIVATDLEPKELPPDLTLPELHAKLQGKTKGAAGLVGLFVKPAN
jgi:Raf kinase inhibitor-like YbhB/YbcL family protein